MNNLNELLSREYWMQYLELATEGGLTDGGIANDIVAGIKKAINYSQCCETLEMEHAATSEEYAEAIIDMNKNPQDSNNAFKKIVLENAIDKFKQDLSKL